jgi:hypothetical protein
MTSPRSLARIAGLLYLVVAVLTGFSELFVRAGALVAGDATATANNVRSSATLFRIGLAADLVGITCFLLVVMALYFLLREFGPRAASAMLIFAAVSVAIQTLNLVNHAGALLAATGPGISTAFGSGGSDALVLLFLELHKQGVFIAQVFFGLWLLPAGYLVYRSGYFPKVLGVALASGCFFYLAALVPVYLSANLDSSLSVPIAMPAGIAETVFAVWLAVKGANTQASEAQR